MPKRSHFSALILGAMMTVSALTLVGTQPAWAKAKKHRAEIGLIAEGNSTALNNDDARFLVRGAVNDIALSAQLNMTSLEDFSGDFALNEPVETAKSLGTGIASYYGRGFHGRKTASGERFNMNALTAAHKHLPFGTLLRVTNVANGRSVVVRINDRGPFVRGRSLDLSQAAAVQVGLVAQGHGRVTLEQIS